MAATTSASSRTATTSTSTAMSFKDITSIDFRVASGGAGGKIELRADSPTAATFASVNVAPTGGWQNWTTVSTPLTGAPAGTHTIYFVFTHATDQGGLFNLNWFQVHGKGAAISAPPEVTATATPTEGQAPLNVALQRHGHRPRGRGAHLPVGLRRHRDHDGHVDARGPDLHLRQRRQLHGEGHGHRRQGHQVLGDGRDPRDRRAQPVPVQRQVGRVQRPGAGSHALERQAQRGQLHRRQRASWCCRSTTARSTRPARAR